MNSWETCALEYRFAGQDEPKDVQVTEYTNRSDVVDPLIYPGLYCPSGLDVMTVLFRIYDRPNPQIDLGPIDCSVSLVVCDLAQSDVPIIYASDAFLAMTGYEKNEVLGRNCRFLQAPGGHVKPKSDRKHIDKKTIRGIREAINANKEHQTQVKNFKKNGKSFINILTIIPIPWDGEDYRYSVGFQCEKS